MLDILDKIADNIFIKSGNTNKTRLRNKTLGDYFKMRELENLDWATLKRNWKFSDWQFRWQGNLSKCKNSHPTTFFRQLILGGRPCLSFRAFSCARVEKWWVLKWCVCARVQKWCKTEVCECQSELSTGYPQVFAGNPPATLILYHTFLLLSIEN